MQATEPNVSYSQQLVPVYLSNFKKVFLRVVVIIREMVSPI
jgi:hypothetical protein